MDWLLDFIDGYKTKIAAVITAVVGVLSAFGVTTPSWFVFLLAGFGLYSVRDAVDKMESKDEEE